MVLYDDASGKYVPLQDTNHKYPRFRHAFSPDGRTFALEERTTRQGPRGRFRDVTLHQGLWDVPTGQRIIAFPEGHSFRCFDPSGRWAATMSVTRGEVRVWDTGQGRQVHRLALATLRGNRDWVGTGTSHVNHFDWTPRHRYFHQADLALHPNGNRLAVVSQGVLHLWDLERLRLLRTFPKPGHFTSVTCVAQNPAAQRVASGGGEGVILLWDRRDGRLLRSLFGHLGEVTALAWSPDGTRLASASADGSIRVWNTNGSLLWTFPDRRRDTGFGCLAFEPGRPRLVAGSADGRVFLLDVKRKKLLAVSRPGGSGVRTLALSADGKHLAVGTAAGKVHLGKVPGLKWYRALAAAAPGGLAFSPGGRFVVTGGTGVQFWDRSRGRLVLTLEVPTGPVEALALDPKARTLHVAPRAGSPWVLDLNSLHRHLSRLGLAFGKAEDRRQKTEG
jgi:WD40 repeat protein